MGERARAAIIDAVGLSFIPLYWILGPATATILFLMFTWGLVRLVVTILMRAYAIYRMRGAGLWILGAVWSLPFQLLVTPFKWASGQAANVADRVGTEMECRALHSDCRENDSQSAVTSRKLVVISCTPQIRFPTILL